MRTACVVNKIDEYLNDAVIDFAVASPSMIIASLLRTCAPPPCETVVDSTLPTPSFDTHRARTGSLSQPIAT
eukprot:3610049-Pleurochrysis_carterae.AAC.1